LIPRFDGAILSQEWKEALLGQVRNGRARTAIRDLHPDPYLPATQRRVVRNRPAGTGSRPSQSSGEAEGRRSLLAPDRFGSRSSENQSPGLLSDPPLPRTSRAASVYRSSRPASSSWVRTRPTTSHAAAALNYERTSLSCDSGCETASASVDSNVADSFSESVSRKCATRSFLALKLVVECRTDLRVHQALSGCTHRA